MKTELREGLEREAARVSAPADAQAQVLDRAVRRGRHRRLGAGVLGLLIAFAVIGGALAVAHLGTRTAGRPDRPGGHQVASPKDPGRDLIRGRVSGVPLSTHDAIGGVAVAGAAAANKDLPFTAFDPSGLGAPNGVYVSDPASTPATGGVIEFDYRVIGVGPVVVQEYAPEAPASTWPAQIAASIALNGQAFTHGTADEITIRGGRDALLLVSENGSQPMVQWYENDGMEMVVYGTGLSPDVAVAIAGKV